MRSLRIAAAAALLAGLTAGLAWVSSPAQAAPPGAAKAIPSPSLDGEKNLVETAKEAGSFKTLLKAATEAGLVDALTDEDAELTVFAPTDSAFKKIPKKDLDALLADKEKLKAVLLYHVVKGKVMAEDVVKLDGKKVKTLGGKEVSVMVKDGKVMLNEDVKVTKTDIGASNGVIHVVNTVLMPPM